MNAKQFNQKWKEYLEDGYRGMEFDHPEIAEYLDEKFSKEIKNNNSFQFSQIKVKFDTVRIHAITTRDRLYNWEKECNRILARKH